MNCSCQALLSVGIPRQEYLEWVAISFSRGSSWPRDGTCISCAGRQVLYHWAMREAPGTRFKGMQKPSVVKPTDNVKEYFLNIFSFNETPSLTLQELLFENNRIFLFVLFGGLCCSYFISFIILATPWSKWNLSSPTRNQTCVPCIGSLNCLTTREVPVLFNSAQH